MTGLRRLCMVAWLALPAPAFAAYRCADDAATRARWEAVRAAPETVDADTLAPLLVECLASPDPVLRDRIGYAVLTGWLRRERVAAPTVERLRQRLQPWLLQTASSRVYARAFAALELSELVRYDGRAGNWSRETLGALLADALSMLAAERDFRGLDDVHGWIHAVAHASDLLWRIARHPLTDAGEQQMILDGVAGKVAPAGHAYVFDEPDRLARVVVAIADRGVVGTATLQAWIETFATPRHMAAWQDAFASPSGMAELHDTKHFLRALREGLRRAGHPQLLPALDSVLGVLP